MESSNPEESGLIPEFKQLKLEADALRNWDKFYMRNSVNFFKDRHWALAEFEQLCPDVRWQLDADSPASAGLRLLEAGCGVGNLLFPLLDECSAVSFAYACDFSPRAIAHLREDPRFSSARCEAFVCDLTCQQLGELVATQSIDLVTLVFVLSAVHPQKMAAVLHNLHAVLKQGGSVLFRDYGLHDHAMLRLAKRRGSKLSEHFYVRQDGTRAFYFSEPHCRALFEQHGFRTAALGYVHRKTVNKQLGLEVPRVFLQARFTKV